MSHRSYGGMCAHACHTGLDHLLLGITIDRPFEDIAHSDRKCLPLINHPRLPQPPTTNHQPPTTNHQPPTTNHQPPTTNHQPPTTNHQPPISNHQPPTTNHHQRRAPTTTTNTTTTTTSFSPLISSGDTPQAGATATTHAQSLALYFASFFCLKAVACETSSHRGALDSHLRATSALRRT
jgi:uncharacterized membrane protein